MKHYLALALIVLSSAKAACAQEGYVIVNLSDLFTGQVTSVAYDINEQGQVIGRVFGDVNGAFFWDRQSAPTVLPLLPDTLPGQMVPRDLNDEGLVIVEGLNEVFLWDAVEGMRALPIPQFLFESAYGLNNHGVAVGSGYNENTAQIRTWIWDAVGGSRLLDDLQEFGGATVPASLNDAGQVVGRSDVIRNQLRYNVPVIWQSDGTVIEIPTMGRGDARDINENGQVVGWDTNQGFFYDPLSGVTDLGDLGPGTEGFIRAWSINDHAIVVGDTERQAFIWDSTHGMRDLNSLIAGQNPFDLINFAQAINNRGEIVATGIDDGQHHAILLIPIPEPAAAVLLIAAMIAWATHRCRRVSG